MQLLLVLMLILAVVYAALVRDMSGAFAEAQYVVAALTMVNSLHVALLLQHTC